MRKRYELYDVKRATVKKDCIGLYFFCKDKIIRTFMESSLKEDDKVMVEIFENGIDCHVTIITKDNLCNVFKYYEVWIITILKERHEISLIQTDLYDFYKKIFNSKIKNDNLKYQYDEFKKYYRKLKLNKIL